jgi:hypothetical protein
MPCQAVADDVASGDDDAGATDGATDGSPPMPPWRGRNWAPMTAMATTAAAPRARGMSLGMSGILHGPMTTR